MYLLGPYCACFFLGRKLSVIVQVVKIATLCKVNFVEIVCTWGKFFHQFVLYSKNSTYDLKEVISDTIILFE